MSCRRGLVCSTSTWTKLLCENWINSNSQIYLCTDRCILNSSWSTTQMTLQYIYHCCLVSNQRFPFTNLWLHPGIRYVHTAMIWMVLAKKHCLWNLWQPNEFPLMIIERNQFHKLSHSQLHFESKFIFHEMDVFKLCHCDDVRVVVGST